MYKVPKLFQSGWDIRCTKFISGWDIRCTKYISGWDIRCTNISSKVYKWVGY